MVNVPIYESKLVQLKNNISEDRILTDGSDWQYAGASTWNEYMLQMDFGISTPNATGNTYVYLRQTDSTHWVRLQYDYNNKKMTLQSNSGSGVVNVDSKTFTDANDPMLDPVNTGANLVAKVSGKRVEVYMNSNLVFNTTISNMSLYGGIALGSTRASWYDNLKISPLSLVSAETLGNLGLIQANDANDILDQLNVVQFADQGSLSYDRGYGAVYFNQTNQSGQYISTKPGEYGAGRISTNYLEASNVNMGKQLTNLTSAKSAFEVLSKQLSVYLGTVDVGLNLLR